MELRLKLKMSNSVKDTPVIVLGLGPSGLFLTRQLGKITQNIYGIGRFDDVGLYSRYIEKKKRFYAQTETELLNTLQKIHSQEAVPPQLYICSDQYLTLLLTSDLPWEEYVTLAGSGFDTLQTLNDKKKVSTYCARNNIQIPHMESYESFAASTTKQYPIIVKWNEKKLNTYSNPIGKIRICSSEDEFNRLDVALESFDELKAELHIQTYIRGNNNWQYSVGGYYRNGIPLAEVVVKQIKQYPQGISAQVIVVADGDANKLITISRELVHCLQFSGFMEMEFKIDSQTKTPYLLDINPRPWGWVSILGKVYPDFYKVLLGENPSSRNENVIWSSPIRKILSVRNRNNVSTSIPLGGYEKAFDIFDIDDLAPSWMIYVMALRKKFKR